MSLREIIKVPNPFLKVTAKPVTVIDKNILIILDDMMETMYNANGIGLAATQIAIDKRLIVMDCGKTKLETQIISEEEYNERMKDKQIDPYPIKMINPEIISLGENLEEREEGCLSIPGYNAKIKRPSSLKVKYTDENKKDKIIDADGLLATCIQHEIDHLNGILFIDHLSKLKREIILKKAIKEYSKS
jgi:peptide deformylase